MSVVSDLYLHCLHMSQKKDLYRFICAPFQMIGSVNNLFPGHLSTAAVLGNYSLYVV